MKVDINTKQTPYWIGMSLAIITGLGLLYCVGVIVKHFIERI